MDENGSMEYGLKFKRKAYIYGTDGRLQISRQELARIIRIRRKSQLGREMERRSQRIRILHRKNYTGKTLDDPSVH